MAKKKDNNKPKEYRFCCPDCEYGSLVVITTESENIYSVVIKIDEIGNHIIEYKDISADGSGKYHYQCNNCGYILKDCEGNIIQNIITLLKWVKEHQK